MYEWRNLQVGLKNKLNLIKNIYEFYILIVSTYSRKAISVKHLLI